MYFVMTAKYVTDNNELINHLTFHYMNWNNYIAEWIVSLYANQITFLILMPYLHK